MLLAGPQPALPRRGWKEAVSGSQLNLFSSHVTLVDRPKGAEIHTVRHIN